MSIINHVRDCPSSVAPQLLPLDALHEALDLGHRRRAAGGTQSLGGAQMPRRAVHVLWDFLQTRRRRAVRGIRREHSLAGFALALRPRDALGLVEFLLNLSERV
jgi:hypothetical protein